MSCTLFSRPRHDSTLEYLYIYSKELVKESQAQSHKTLNKEESNANKATILQLINQQHPELIMFNGHGNSEVIFGHNDEAIISSKDNPEMLKNAITYSLSCSSALKLGPKAVEKGALCFVGYEDDFAIGRDPESEATPAKDKIAKLFLEPSNILVKSILKRNTVAIAIDRAKRKMEENLSYLHTTEDFPEAIDYAPYLFGNLLGLIAHGNKQTSLD